MTAAGEGMSSASATPDLKDGRRLRSARTRRLIVDAYLALLRERPRIPTAAAIAQRAGYSVRSVFERFPDLHALRVAATDEALLRASTRIAARPATGSRSARIRVHVETRGETCKEWLPLWRALNANQGDSSELQSRIRLIREMVVQRIEDVYAPELSTLEPCRRRQTVLAIEALVDFESWARLRGLFGLSFEDACAVWMHAIDRLLPGTSADS